jgi:hypothetical protein
VLEIDGKGIVTRAEALRPATLKAHRRPSSSSMHHYKNRVLLPAPDLFQ